MTDLPDRPPDELLVDIGHEHAVIGKLAELVHGVRITGIDDDHRLGLTRITLGNAVAPAEPRPVPPDADPMDLLVRRLRQWVTGLPVPFTVDRTRETEQVGSMPHVKGTPTPTSVPILDGVAGAGAVPAGRPVAPRVGVADAQPFGHRDLVGRFVGDPFPDPSPDPFATELPGHATFVVGTLLQHAPDAVPVCRTVLTPRVNAADRPNSVWAVARRLIGFLDDDVDVVNMSFACRTGGPTTPPLPLERAVQALATRGIVLVAAGGNEGTVAQNPPWPAAFPQVVAVGSADTDLPGLDYLDLLAPGENVTGPFLQGTVQLPGGLPNDPPEEFASGYVTWGGSSFAAAYVTGRIARLMSEHGIPAVEAVDRLTDDPAAGIRPAPKS